MRWVKCKFCGAAEESKTGKGDRERVGAEGATEIARLGNQLGEKTLESWPEGNKKVGRPVGPA